MDGLSAFRASSIGFTRELARQLPGAECWTAQGLVIGITGWNLSAFNSAIVLDENALSAAALDFLGSIFADTGLPFSIVVFSQDAVPACDTFLKSNGYAVLFTDPVLACQGPLGKLTALPRDVPRNPAVRVQAATTTRERQIFREVVTEVFQMPMTFSAEMFDQLLDMQVNKLMLAWLDDTPVGAGMLFYSDGIAAIYNVATLEPCRRQGIGTRMMQALHSRALLDGYTGTVLAALPDGQALYQRLGYHLAGYQISYSIAEQVHNISL